MMVTTAQPPIERVLRHAIARLRKHHRWPGDAAVKAWAKETSLPDALVKALYRMGMTDPSEMGALAWGESPLLDALPASLAAQVVGWRDQQSVLAALAVLHARGVLSAQEMTTILKGN